MIIRPTRRIIESVHDIHEFKKFKRDVIIYTDGDKSRRDTDFDICIINSSVQDGNCGGFITRPEVLHSCNFYYGIIMNPFILHNEESFDKNNVRLNLDAHVFITEFKYLHKLSNTIREESHTASIYDEIFSGDIIKFKNNYEILPPDPRFYNLDHQLITTSYDTPFVTPDREELSNVLWGAGCSHTYRLRELVGEGANLYINEIIYDDPFKMMQIPVYRQRSINVDDTISGIIYRSVMSIINAAMKIFLTKFTIIIDSELMYNITEAHRYLHFDKYQLQDDNIAFASTIEHVWETICDLDINMRLTIHYTHPKTYVQILPLDKDLQHSHVVREKDVTIKNMIEDIYNTY